MNDGCTIRKTIRLDSDLYRSDGAYFITICTKDRKKMLSKIHRVGDDAHIVPTAIGRLAEKYIRSIPGIDKYVIMPNHIHMIIRVADGPMWASAPTQPIPSRIRSFKTLVTKELGESIFQRSFYDHIIRNQADYDDIYRYIEENPLRWELDELYNNG